MNVLYFDIIFIIVTLFLHKFKSNKENMTIENVHNIVHEKYNKNTEQFKN
mgnify:CR=1 FL=1